MKAMDVGCGIGDLCKSLASLGFGGVIGTEPSLRCVDLGVSTLPQENEKTK